MGSLKPLIALYKAYRGGEWFGASLESVREHCAGIVVVLSDQPWKAVPGESHPPGNCLEPLTKFQQKHHYTPTKIIRPDARQNTEEQYALGLGYIKEVFPECGVLIVDTDEVWDDASLTRLREYMTEDREALIFRAGIRTYLKSPLYRVTPMEPARVVVGLAHPDLPTGKSRFANLHSLVTADKIRDVPGAVVHHYGYVRLDPWEITSKLANSTSQDRVPTVPDWKRVVWDRLPEGTNLHPQRGFERCWGAVEEITLRECPEQALLSETFWAGVAQGEPLFTQGDGSWRRRVEQLPSAQCPATTVHKSFGPSLAEFVRYATGVTFDQEMLNFLIPRLRMSFRETLQLAVLAADLPADGQALEVGSGLGGSMAVMILFSQETVWLTAVDPYLPYDEQNVVLDKNVREGSESVFWETVRGLTSPPHPTNRVDLLKHSSKEAAPTVPINSLDLLLIDGNHSYVNCKEDLDLWWPKLKPGGILLVHDYATRFPGVIRAIQEFETEKGVRFNLPTLSTLAWLRKP